MVGPGKVRPKQFPGKQEGRKGLDKHDREKLHFPQVKSKDCETLEAGQKLLAPSFNDQGDETSPPPVKMGWILHACPTLSFGQPRIRASRGEAQAAGGGQLHLCLTAARNLDGGSGRAQ